MTLPFSALAALVATPHQAAAAPALRLMMSWMTRRELRPLTQDRRCLGQAHQSCECVGQRAGVDAGRPHSAATRHPAAHMGSGGSSSSDGRQALTSWRRRLKKPSQACSATWMRMRAAAGTRTHAYRPMICSMSSSVTLYSPLSRPCTKNSYLVTCTQTARRQ
eukprot:352826-Chlamydomonas_euryale.AAC.3